MREIERKMTVNGFFQGLFQRKRSDSDDSMDSFSASQYEPPEGELFRPRSSNHSDNSCISCLSPSSHNRWMRRMFYVLPEHVNEVKSLLERSLKLKEEGMQHHVYLDNTDSELFQARVSGAEMSPLVRLSWNRYCRKGEMNLEIETYHKRQLCELVTHKISSCNGKAILRGKVPNFINMPEAIENVFKAKSLEPVVMMEYWRQQYEKKASDGELTVSVFLDENFRCTPNIKCSHIGKLEPAAPDNQTRQFPYALLSLYQVIDAANNQLLSSLLDSGMMIEVSCEFHKYIASYAKLNGVPDAVQMRLMPAWVSMSWEEITESIEEGEGESRGLSLSLSRSRSGRGSRSARSSRNSKTDQRSSVSSFSLSEPRRTKSAFQRLFKKEKTQGGQRGKQHLSRLGGVQNVVNNANGEDMLLQTPRSDRARQWDTAGELHYGDSMGDSVPARLSSRTPTVPLSIPRAKSSEKINQLLGSFLPKSRQPEGVSRRVLAQVC